MCHAPRRTMHFVDLGSRTMKMDGSRPTAHPRQNQSPPHFREAVRSTVCADSCAVPPVGQWQPTNHRLGISHDVNEVIWEACFPAQPGSPALQLRTSSTHRGHFCADNVGPAHAQIAAAPHGGMACDGTSAPQTVSVRKTTKRAAPVRVFRIGPPSARSKRAQQASGVLRRAKYSAQPPCQTRLSPEHWVGGETPKCMAVQGSRAISRKPTDHAE